jgi:multidrug efflux system membrane fusion protein
MVRHLNGVWRTATAAVAMAATAAGGCGKGAAPPAAGGMPGVPVMAVAAVSQDVPVYIDEIGKTSPTETVTIIPQVSGKIVSRDFADGADLHKGQLLFQVDPRPFKAALDQAVGQLKKDEATKVSADWNVSQDQAALLTHSISEQQLHTDTAARDQAIGAIAVDNAMIDQANLNMEYCRITAPIDGLAGERLVDAGNVVLGGSQMTGTSLLVVNKIDPIYADFTVTEAELQRVQRYMARGTLAVSVMTPADQDLANAPAPAAPAAAPGNSSADDRSANGANRPTTGPAPFQPRTGKLIFLDNAVQDASGTVRLRAELPNGDHHFWPGQFVNVRLILTNKPSVLIPATAAQISQQGLFVYLVSPNANSPTKAIAAMRPVTLGQQHGDMVVVEKGLSAGDQVVSSGFTMLQPDAPIMVINAGPPGAGPPGGAPPKTGPGTLKSPGSDGKPKGGPQASAASVQAEGSHS